LDRLAGHGLHDLEAVAQRAHAGDPVVLAAVRDGAARLGRVLAAIVATVNPNRLVLGGTIGQLPVVAEEVERRVREDAVERATRKLRVVSSRFGDDSATIGLTVMVVRHVFSADAIDARLG
jgi:predicted NBD/HSP70 family sugar kinase